LKRTVLVLAAVAVLSACGSDASTEAGDATTTSSPTTTTNVAASTTTTGDLHYDHDDGSGYEHHGSRNHRGAGDVDVQRGGFVGGAGDRG